MTTPGGDALVLAVNTESGLPAWLSWVGPHNNFGDVTYRTYFTGYQPLGGRGLNLPSGYNTVSDFRNVVQQKLYVDRYEVDAPVPDLSAPSDIRGVAAPLPSPPTVAAIPVAKGVWFMKVTPDGNSTLFEFADHLTLFELFGSEAQALAVIGKARTTVPGKPVTQVIFSHFHIDHTGGLRAAVAEGLTIITNRQNADYVREVTSRPATVFPDELGRNPRPVKIIPVDDRLELKDGTMQVELYRVVNNSHYAEGLVAHVPKFRLLSQGDLVDPNWDLIWWGNSYPDTVSFWGIQVDKDLPVHGDIHTYSEVMAALKLQTANAQKLCTEVAAAHLSIQGCPVSNTVPE
jgi:hypothetical protein